MSDKAIYTIELNDRLSPGLKKAVANSIGFDRQMKKTRGGLGRTTKSMGGASKGLGAMGGMFTKLLGPIAIASAALKALKMLLTLPAAQPRREPKTWLFYVKQPTNSERIY